MSGADTVAVRDGGEALDVNAQHPGEGFGFGLAQLRKLLGDMCDRAVVLAELLAERRRERRGDIAVVAQCRGQRLRRGRLRIGVGDLGKNVGEAIDSIDEQGIPGEIPPNQLKDTMKKAGIDIDEIAGNLGDAAVFVEGRTRATLAGALVIEAKDATEARNTVSNVGTLLRANGTPGVTAVGGEASGFSVRSPDLGAKPLVVAAEGERIAIGYGLPATLAGLGSESGPTLAKTKAYNEALNSLGGTPITGFAAGAPVLRLVEGLLTDADQKEELEELVPYLSKVPFLAIGSETNGDVVQAKLILGVTE